MDALQEYIVPIIVAIIWIASKFFGSKLDEDGPPPQGRSPSPEQAERNRQIQEEIRRKIAERRQQGEGPSPSAAPPPPVPQPASQGQMDEPPPLPQTQTHTQPHMQPHTPEDYQAELQRRRQQILATKAQADAARAETVRKEARARGVKSRKEARAMKEALQRSNFTGTPAEFIYAALSSPTTSRNAFVFQEVIGAPIALRRTERIGAVEF